MSNDSWRELENFPEKNPFRPEILGLGEELSEQVYDGLGNAVIEELFANLDEYKIDSMYRRLWQLRERIVRDMVPRHSENALAALTSNHAGDAVQYFELCAQLADFCEAIERKINSQI